MRPKTRTDWKTYDELEAWAHRANRDVIAARADITRAYDCRLINIDDVRNLVKLANQMDKKPSEGATYMILKKWREQYSNVRSNRPLPRTAAGEDFPQSIGRFPEGA